MSTGLPDGSPRAGGAGGEARKLALGCAAAGTLLALACLAGAVLVAARPPTQRCSSRWSPMPAASACRWRSRARRIARPQ